MASFCGGLIALLIFYLISIYVKGKVRFLEEFTVHPAIFGVLVSFLLFYFVSIFTHQRGSGGSDIETGYRE